MPLGVKPLSGLSRPPLSGEAEDGLKVVDSGEAVSQDDNGHPEGAVVGAVERRVVLSRMEDGEGGLDFGAGLFDFGVGHSIYHNTQTAPHVQKKVELFWMPYAPHDRIGMQWIATKHGQQRGPFRGFVVCGRGPRSPPLVSRLLSPTAPTARQVSKN